MKNFICSLLLSCVAAAPAVGGDAGETLRDRRILCDQFVIEHPDPAAVLDFTLSCCRFGHRLRDCVFRDADTDDR